MANRFDILIKSAALRGEPGQLGERVRGITATGTAREVPPGLAPMIAQTFVARWPRAAQALTPRTPDLASTSSRLYEIVVVDWVLFDEVNFPEQPRVPIAAG